MKCVIAWKYDDENGKQKYQQFAINEFENKNDAEKYINDYLKNGEFAILGKNTQ